MRTGFKWLSTTLLVILVLFILLAKWGANLYIDWLWFKTLGYGTVFTTILFSELGLRLAVGLTAFLVIFINLMLTRKPVLKRIATSKYTETDDGVINIHQSQISNYLSPRLLTGTYLAISAVLAFLVSTAVSGEWIVVQKYLNSTMFGQSEPIFNKDIGYYVFQLPFYQLIYKLIVWLLFLSAITVGTVYFLAESSQGVQSLSQMFSSNAVRYHFSILASLFFAVRAWGYKLEQFMLMYSQSGVVFGPGYTDIHARLIAYKVLLVISLIIALVILVNLFLKKFRLILYSVGALLAVSIILGGIYPTIVQNLLVKPNELNRESPYIDNSIKYTRLAYNLDTVEINKYPAGQRLTTEDVVNNPETIKNIRLWDWKPLRETYEQLQEIRPYYELKNIDIDRYMINGEYRQVMLAPRELNQNLLPEEAKTWINQRLKYTHGYGITMNPVNETNNEGLPNFFIQNIPPVSHVDLEVTRPEVYFGEYTNNYVIVNTKTKEFDYPIGGNENAHTIYEGDYGVKMGGLLNKLIFALALTDYKLLLASDIESTSQVLYHRHLSDRVPRLAPFLAYDEDPYIVLDDNGSLQWMWDAYTISDMFPYSDPFSGRNNYIRNSVKVVVDAYTGTVDFYIADTEDPVIKTYEKIFPGVFKPLEQMPADLKAHIRYPVDYFLIQAKKYAVYHMTDTEVLYNQEDKWNIPKEKFYNEEVSVEPYYVITKLLDSDKPEFVLILPFVPNNKTNMIAWMAARSDAPNYGKLLVYEFPKQQLVYGPMQIEARIDQDTTISQQLTLWNQRGSSVIRGNLLVIPVKDALLYVEPLYLQAEQSKMPELRRVIVTHGEQVVMEQTLELALQKIFGAEARWSDPEPGVESPDPGEPTVAKTLQELITEANNLYNQAQAQLKDGNWAGYGQTLDQLKEALDLMAEQSKE